VLDRRASVIRYPAWDTARIGYALSGLNVAVLVTAVVVDRIRSTRRRDSVPVGAASRRV
jgi:hypothetical protein